MRSIVWDGDIRVSQPFGCTAYDKEPFYAPCKLQGGHKHCGIDIALWKGSALRAARAGVVTAVGYGYLQVKIGTQLWDYYVHIDRSLVGVGQAVARGQLIAYSGDKAPSFGFVDGAHLHFEVQTGRFNLPGTCLDPVPVLNAAAAFSAGGGSTTGGFGTLTDAEIQARFVAVLDAIAGNRAATDAIDGAMFYPETDPKWGTYSALFNRRLEAAAVKAAGGSLTAAQAQTLQEAHDAVQQLAAARASDQAAVVAADATIKAELDEVAADLNAVKAKTDRDLA